MVVRGDSSARTSFQFAIRPDLSTMFQRICHQREIEESSNYAFPRTALI